MYNTAIGHIDSKARKIWHWRIRYRLHWDKRRSHKFRSTTYLLNSFFNVSPHTTTATTPADGFDQDYGKMTVNYSYKLEQSGLTNRSLFWTNPDFISISSSRHLHPEDQVVLFDGDTTPFILCKILQADETEQEVYRIVRSCYLYDFMDETQSDHAPLYEPHGYTHPPVSQPHGSPKDDSAPRVCPVTGRALKPRMFTTEWTSRSLGCERTSVSQSEPQSMTLSLDQNEQSFSARE